MSQQSTSPVSDPAALPQHAMLGVGGLSARRAAHWLATEQTPMVLPTRLVNHLVQISAHTPAWVWHQGDVWLSTFTEQRVYAGQTLRFGNGPSNCHCDHC